MYYRALATRESRGSRDAVRKTQCGLCRLGRSCISGSICYSLLFSAISAYCKASFFSWTSRHSLIFLDSKLLPSPSFSSSLRKTRTDPWLRNRYPLAERKIFLFYHVLPDTSDSGVEGEQRCNRRLDERSTDRYREFCFSRIP